MVVDPLIPCLNFIKTTNSPSRKQLKINHNFNSETDGSELLMIGCYKV